MPSDRHTRPANEGYRWRIGTKKWTRDLSGIGDRIIRAGMNSALSGRSQLETDWSVYDRGLRPVDRIERKARDLAVHF